MILPPSVIGLITDAPGQVADKLATFHSMQLPGAQLEPESVDIIGWVGRSFERYPLPCIGATLLAAAGITYVLTRDTSIGKPDPTGIHSPYAGSTFTPESGSQAERDDMAKHYITEEFVRGTDESE